jgi:hypothetical protein
MQISEAEETADLRVKTDDNSKDDDRQRRPTV